MLDAITDDTAAVANTPIIHNSTPETALKRIAMGFRYVTVSSDARLMAAGSQQVLAKMRTTPPPAAPAGPY